MYLGEVRVTSSGEWQRNVKKSVQGPPANKSEVDRLPQKVSLPPIPPEKRNKVYSTYNGPLLSKYKMTDIGEYSSNNPASIFENILSFIKGDLFESMELWKSPKFANARVIDERLRKSYRKSSGGHSGYTFHTITVDEINIIHNCLFG